MKCTCYETETEFVLCAEDVAQDHEGNVLAAWFRKDGDRYIKAYPKQIGDKELIRANFSRLGESMLTGAGDWRAALHTFADRCIGQIEWYITGSASEAVLGVEIKPHDLDLVIHTEDFNKVRELFAESVVEPFQDLGGSWVVRYFGRLCIDGVMADIVADESRDKEHHVYDAVDWNDHRIWIEPLEARYETELQRDRKDRIEAIQTYMDRMSQRK